MKEFGDQTLHFCMTAAPLLLVAFFPREAWSYPIAAFWFMFWREDAQHRSDEGWAWIWGGYWRWIDIGCGTLGGVAVGIVSRFWLEEINMLDWLNPDNIIPIVTAVVTLAAAIAAITPSKADNKVIQVILDLLNTLGLNIGKAKNADDTR